MEPVARTASAEPDAADFRHLILRDELLFLCPHGALRVDVDALVVLR